jgi:hypothetical protein
MWGGAWEKALVGQDVFWGTDTPEQHYNEGIRLLSNPEVIKTINDIKPMVDSQGVRIERKVELRVPGVPIPIIGYIDVQLEDGTPADLKTSSKSWTDDKAADSLQSLFYLAALNQAGEKVNWKFRHKPSELFFLFELIQRVWQGIEREVFPINPTTWKCSDKYCDYYAQCRGKYME